MHFIYWVSNFPQKPAHSSLKTSFAGSGTDSISKKFWDMVGGNIPQNQKKRVFIRIW